MGIRQALLANGFPSARKILVQKGLLLYFDEVVISCEVGLVKPDQEIYEYLIGRAHVQPKQAVFIDDRDYFVQGANLAGIQGIWFNAHGDKAKEWQGEEISRLDQLATLLGQGAFLAPVAI
jgi:putative hydrolase of the HAD superfamily